MINPTSTTAQRRVPTPPLVLRDAHRPLRGLTPGERFAKRLVDIMVSSVAILLALPMFLLIAIAVKVNSSGPVLFRQKRVGEGGRLFEVYKFRTMVLDAHALHSAVTHQNRPGHPPTLYQADAHLTRIGSVLRAMNLDVLPQLFNVLMGDMSLVGPPPELPWTVDQFPSWQRARFLVPPGMTGWWRVNGRSAWSAEDDLYYVRNYSFWLDCRIILMTIAVMFQGDGALKK